MKKLFITIIASVLGCMTISAQDYVEAPYPFVGVRGGVQSIFLQKNDGDRKITPAAGISLGYMFNPYLGARADFQGVWNKFEAGNVVYDLKSLTSEADLMLNLTNCFRSEKNKPFNLYLIGGAGAISTWDESSTAEGHFLEDWYNFRAGLMADVRLSRITSLNLEIDGNYMGGSKSEIFGDNKFKLGVYAGLIFRIPAAAAAAAVASAPITTDAEYEAAQARAAAEAAAAAAAAKKAKEAEQARKVAAERAATAAAAKAAEEAKINETIFFTIGKTDKAEKFNDVVEKAAEWCKKYPEKTLNVAGYADKGTGTAKINARVAEKRAAAVANAIKAKGIAADQLSISSYGDKVQPYAENDENRCVIVSSK